MNEDDDGDGLPMPFSEILSAMAFAVVDPKPEEAVFE